MAVYTDKTRGVRDEMVKRYGLDNSKIGWDGKNVTYDGKYFMTPSNVSDGKSYASETDIQKAASTYFSNGDIGVRTALAEKGVDTSKLGYNNGIITYDGKNLMTPERVQNGVSYVSNPNDITNAAIEAHKINGKNVIKAEDYVKNNQLPFDVSYNNGNVTIAGQNVKPVFVADGYAYVDSSDIDKVFDGLGIKGNAQLYKQYKDEITPYQEKYIDAIENREPFTYDYSSDPVYQAYKDMYTREGDRVMRDVMGEYAANTGGYINSAGITAGAQANNYYMQQLADKIPQLHNDAYDRYNTEYKNKVDGYGRIIDLKQNAFGTDYDVNNDIINGFEEQNLAEQQREENMYKQLAEEEKAIYENIMQSGMMLGYFTDEQNQWLAAYYNAPEGTTFDPFGIEKNTAAAEYEIDSKYKPTKTTSYSSKGSGSQTETKAIKETISGINTYLKSQFPYTEKLLGENGGDVLKVNNNGTVEWNPAIFYSGNQHAFDEIVLQVLNNSQGISDRTKENILIGLMIDLSDEKFDGMY